MSLHSRWYQLERADNCIEWSQSLGLHFSAVEILTIRPLGDEIFFFKGLEFFGAVRMNRIMDESCRNYDRTDDERASQATIHLSYCCWLLNQQLVFVFGDYIQ